MTEGTRAPRIVSDDLARFRSYLQQSETGCWLWQGALSAGGYGTFRVRRDGRAVTVSVHRWSYERHVGPIPAGLHLDHLCRARHCANPAHLEPVTQTENTRRGARGSLITHCKRGHLLAGDNLLNTARGRRACRLCDRERQRAAAVDSRP